MNLIELQDQLRSMPVQALQQYANGMNPQVPPWLALSVLQQKQMDAQRQEVAQGAAAEPMPTVKEKVEQSADLMGLMELKKRQADQNATAQKTRMPAPVPGGVEPARPQPEPPATEMRAGGIVSLPTGLRMAGGGLVSFAAGDSVSSPAGRYARKKLEEYDAYRRRVALKDQLRRKYAPASSLVGLLMEQSDLDRAKAQDIMSRLDDMSEAELANLLARRAPVDIPGTAAPAPAAATDEEPSGIKNLLAQRARSTARLRDAQNVPAAAPQAEPAAPQASQVEPAVPQVPQALAAAPQAAQVTPQTTAPKMPTYDTPEAAFEAQQQINQLSGYKAPEYTESRNLDDEIRARLAAQEKANALPDLFNVLTGSARGYGGMTATAKELRDQRTAAQKAEDERRAGLASTYDTGKQGFAEKTAVGAGNILGKGITESGATQRSREQIAGSTERTKMEIDARTAVAALDRDFNLQKLKSTTEMALRELAETSKRNTLTADANQLKERQLALTATKELVSTLQEQLQNPTVMADTALKNATQAALAEAQDALRAAGSASVGFLTDLPTGTGTVVPGPGAK